MKTIYKTLLVFIILYSTACNIVNPKEGIPTYIQIDSVQVVPTISSKHGSVSHKITDVWVYYNRQLLGAYQLPAKVPVLAQGKGQLQIVAGIWDNGLSGTRTKYPFYTFDLFDFDQQDTKTLNHIPIFNYRTTDTPEIKYFIEGFEQGNSFAKRDGDTTFTKTNLASEVFEEDWSSKVELKDTIKSFESITTQEYFLPPNRECYMELNYKTEAQMEIRLEINYQGTLLYSDVIGLNAKDQWTKIYINLTGFATTFQNAKFKIILKGQLPENKTSAIFLIDNFKIMYYK